MSAKLDGAAKRAQPKTPSRGKRSRAIRRFGESVESLYDVDAVRAHLESRGFGMMSGDGDNDLAQNVVNAHLGVHPRSYSA